MQIAYRSEDFPASAGVANGYRSLQISWDDLLWSALTVGRPNRQYVFQHGEASLHEALFRLSLVRMALEENSSGSRFRRTTAARTLDPTEKGAINYFLGLAVCKLFAAKLLSAPWMLHLDVFRPFLNPFLTGRSRPDLVGLTTKGDWIALECKGRISKPDGPTMQRAKYQATRLVSVNGVSPRLYVGGLMFFAKDVLQFYWRDPEPEPEIKNPIRIILADDAWRYYYQMPLGIIQTNPACLRKCVKRTYFLRSVLPTSKLASDHMFYDY
jgi:hypothetical protein